MHLPNGADHAAAHQFHRLSNPRSGYTPIPHLRRDPGAPGQLLDELGFGEVVRERFLTIDMLSGVHRNGGYIRMKMVGSGTDHRVNSTLLVQQDSEVLVLRTRKISDLLAIVRLDLASHGSPSSRSAFGVALLVNV